MKILLRWEKFKSLKKRQEKINDKMKEVDYEEYERLLWCGYYVSVLKCKRCGAGHFAGFQRCKSRFCIVCNRIRTLKYIKKVLERSSIESNNYFHLVLTLRNMEDLGAMVDRINNFWRIFYNDDKEFRKWWRERFLGGIRSMEIKRGNEGWHVHLHVLLISGKEFNRDFEVIRDRWKKVTLGEGSVYIKKAMDYKVVVEVVKYITNIEKIGIDDLADVYFAIKRKRIINTFGIIRGLEVMVEEELEEDIEKDVNFICKKCGFEKFEVESIIFDDSMSLYDL